MSDRGRAEDRGQIWLTRLQKSCSVCFPSVMLTSLYSKGEESSRKANETSEVMARVGGSHRRRMW